METLGLQGIRRVLPSWFSNFSERSFISAWQCSAVLQSQTAQSLTCSWNIVSLHNPKLSPPMLLNPSGNLPNMPSGISFPHVSAEGKSQGKAPWESVSMLFSNTICFFLISLRSNDTTGIFWDLSSYCMRELERRLRHKTGSQNVVLTVYLWWSRLMNSQIVVQSFSTPIRCSGSDTSSDAITHVGLGLKCTSPPAPRPRSPQEGTNTTDITPSSAEKWHSVLF